MRDDVTPKFPGVITSAVNCAGFMGPDTAIVELRCGAVVEIGDEGINVYSSPQIFQGGGSPDCSIVFSPETGAEACEHTGEEITDDDVITVARWLPQIAGSDIRKVIRFGLATGRGHAAQDESRATTIATAWAS